jgi:exodeoxyribonuclease V beta subunit
VTALPFDPESAALEGTHLIEAAAGTGKTHSLEGLYLRLVVERRLPVEEILVVTFTQAAAAELRERLLARLMAAREAVEGAAREPDAAASRRTRELLRRAVTDFDQAAVATIHGFCQRVLQEHAFETGSLFAMEILTDPAPIVQEIADDFWRRTVASEPPEFVAHLLDRWKGPEAFPFLLEALKTPVFRMPAPTPEPALGHLEAYRAGVDALRRMWPQSRAAVIAALNDPALDSRTFGKIAAAGHCPRQARTQALAAALDAFLFGSAPPPFPPPEGLSRLRSDFIASRTRRGAETPRHAVFECCREIGDSAAALAAEMERRRRHLAERLIETGRAELARRKLARNVRGFDDLLTGLADALAGPGGAGLVEAVQRRFRAALVDEFQDTDDLQVEILFRLFSGGGRPFFLIGDPKQAIYGFRGADIFSYLRAARRAESVRTLGANRRSVPGLVAAVNTLFGRHPQPFLIPGIGFTPAAAAAEEKAAEAGSSRCESPLEIWYLDSRRVRTDGKPAAVGEAEPRIAGALAAEIARMVSAKTPAGDMAVLVRTNRQARIVKAALSAQRVPAVVCSAGDVFASREAEELERLLAGIASPADPRRVKAALATRIMGVRAAELTESGWNSAAGAERSRRIHAYHRTWAERGFMPMFRRLVSAEGVKARLLSGAEGERRLTNLLHLSELLHQAEERECPGMAGLVGWLAGRRRAATGRIEEHQLRLESDAQAVQIVTIHKSKGLQYPIVFCPFAWSSTAVREAPFFFHDPQAGDRLTLALEAGEEDAARLHAEGEWLAEGLRLLYVAVTRARERCVLVWGRIRGIETSAPAYLLHFPGDGAPLWPPGPPPSLLRRLAGTVAAKSDAELLADLDALAGESAGAIGVRPLPEPSAAPPPRAEENAPEELVCRDFTGRIDRSWRAASFSMLAKTAASDDTGADRGDPSPFEPPSARPAAAATAVDPAGGIFGFPRGARAGDFFHGLLEKVDFSAAGSGAVRELVIERLAACGFDPAWRDPVCRLVSDLAEFPIFPEEPDLALARVPAAERAAEMPFIYPLKRLSPEILSRVFLPFAGRRSGAFDEEFCRRLGRLELDPARGIMKGVMDLVIRHAGRFYLVDWKSNHLGDRTADYHRRQLGACMQASLYVLQYHIYAVALHRFLKLRVPGYAYARHFGGVSYVFLRGVDRRRGPEYGLVVDRPDPELIETFERELIDGAP